MEGLNFLGTSGQNVKDMMLNSISKNEDEGLKCLRAIKQTLEMRHLCPTAPDTLRVYPFKESDPFVISGNELNFDEDQDNKSLYTQVPHVYFVGNMEAYNEELLCQKNQYLKVISLPTFATTHSIVLLDMCTLQSFEVAFDFSEKVVSREELKKQNIRIEKERYSIDTMDID
jgi:DNA polymerase delta subunit 2